METNRLTFWSEIIAKAAIVIPIANDPAFPTKILPAKLRYVKINQKSNGPIIRYEDGEKTIRPKITIVGQTVYNPFKPPNWFTVLVTIITINGIMIKI